MRLFIGAFGRKTMCWNVLRNFSKIFIRILLKMHYFCIFFQRNLTNHSLFFCAFGQKTQRKKFEKSLKIFDENSNEKLNFYLSLFFEYLLLKIEPSKITSFLQQFFSVSGGGALISLLSPWLRPCTGCPFEL